MVDEGLFRGAGTAAFRFGAEKPGKGSMALSFCEEKEQEQAHYFIRIRYAFKDWEAAVTSAAAARADSVSVRFVLPCRWRLPSRLRTIFRVSLLFGAFGSSTAGGGASPPVFDLSNIAIMTSSSGAAGDGDGGFTICSAGVDRERRQGLIRDRRPVARRQERLDAPPAWVVVL